MKEKVDYLISLIHKDEIDNFKYYTCGFQKEYQKVENINLGYIPFLNVLNVNFVDAVLPDIYKTNRNCNKRESTEYICIHDTANGAPRANAKMHHRWIYNMATDPENKNTVSWHYVIGNDEIYQHIPLDEVAHHAGDGTRVKLEFFKTSVKANNDKPVFDISSDGYYIINNVKTEVKCPLDEEGRIPTKDKLPYSGISYKIDDSGNYLLGNTWWSNTYKRIGNYGGNLNSIGIETCVNTGVNYTTVMRNTAKIVGMLLNKYNLSINRVKQHNDFSGKNCPMSMRISNRWEEFIWLIEIEKYYQENLSDVKIEFISLDPEYLDNYGNVKKYEEGKTIKYLVRAIKDNEIYERTLESKMGKCNY